MSLIPPVPLVLSKLKYHIMNRYKDDEEEMKRVLQKLGPFYNFKLSASFRDSYDRTTEITDIRDLIDCETDVWDCIDTALFMLTRMKDAIKSRTTATGFLRTSIMFDGPDDRWFELYLDEQPINMVGLVTEESVDLGKLRKEIENL